MFDLIEDDIMEDVLEEDEEFEGWKRLELTPVRAVKNQGDRCEYTFKNFRISFNKEHKGEITVSSINNNPKHNQLMKDRIISDILDFEKILRVLEPKQMKSSFEYLEDDDEDLSEEKIEKEVFL